MWTELSTTTAPASSPNRSGGNTCSLEREESTRIQAQRRLSKRRIRNPNRSSSRTAIEEDSGESSSMCPHSSPVSTRSVAEHERYRQNVGFTTLLIILKSLTLCFMIGMTTYTYFISSRTVNTLGIFTLLEVLLLGLVLVFVCIQRLSTLVTLIFCEMLMAIAEIVLGLTIALVDKGKECMGNPSKCRIMELYPKERFYFVFLMIVKAAIRSMICLIITAQSPLVQDYNREYFEEKKKKIAKKMKEARLKEKRKKNKSKQNGTKDNTKKLLDKTD